MLQHEDGLAGLLDETIAALAGGDGERLEGLQVRVAAIAPGFESGQVRADTLAKRDVLEALLRSSRLNLDLLRRLQGGEARDRWER